MTLAGRKVEILLSRKQREHVICGDEIVGAPPSQVKQRHIISYAAGVMGKMADGDLAAEILQLRDVLPHIVIDREFALASEQEERRGGELFGDGADVKH